MKGRKSGHDLRPDHAPHHPAPGHQARPAAVSNETINLLKDTSLVYILAMNDILRITRSIVQRDFDTTAFLVAAVFYLFFTFILTKVFGYLEKRYAVYDE